MNPERFLLASTDEGEKPTYILHTRFPKALIQIVHTNYADNAGKVYSYMLQNEVQPRYLKFIVQPYDKADYTNILDEAWQWLNQTALLAA